MIRSICLVAVEKAKKALGQNFSLKEFHNAILDAGSLPVDLLERPIVSYISSVRR